MEAQNINVPTVTRLGLIVVLSKKLKRRNRLRAIKGKTYYNIT